jgi:hypothetical protein
MPAKRYPFEPGGPVRLEINAASTAPYDWLIKLDGQLVNRVAGKDALRGVRMQLPDGSALELQLVYRRFAQQVIVRRNGALLPGSEPGEITVGKRQPMSGSALLVGVLGGLCMLVVVVSGAVGVIQSLGKSSAEQAAHQALRASYAERMAAFTRSPQHTAAAPAGEPRIDGPLVVVDKTDNALDRFYASHPSALPDSPDAVKYVLWLECESRQVGTYSDGMRALQQTCGLTLIDLAADAIIDQRSLAGPRPPEVKKHGGDATGGRPDDEIEAYIFAVQK